MLKWLWQTVFPQPDEPAPPGRRPDLVIQPISPAQAERLGHLIAQAGGRRYEATKRALGFPLVAVNQMTAEQAAWLIDRLEQELGQA